MAPRKRQLSDDPSDLDDGESSSNPQSSPKRARLNESPASDDVALYESDPDTTALDIAATQAVKQRMEGATQSAAAEGGIIIAVICENFMCHRFLDMPFGPYMNFVIGHNGSGKSAILTALTLCLGGKAASTNRGTSMKSFIKEGEDTARITVKLKNGGEGFKRDVYGDVIVIERNFSRDGGSGYKLKSKAGKTVSSKKEELDNICDFYGLQVDNPMTILTQDMARQFLSSSSNAQKYKFFSQGVQLEQLDQDYNLISTAIKNTEAMLESKKEAVNQMKQRHDEAYNKLKQLDSQKGLRQKHVDLQLQMAWVQVRDAKTEVEKQDTLITQMRGKIAKAEETRIKATEAFQAANREDEMAAERIKEEEEKLVPFQDEKVEHKEKFDKNKADLLGIQSEERQIKGSLTHTKRGIEELGRKITVEEQRLEERNGGNSVLLMESIKKAEAKILELRLEISKLEEQRLVDEAGYDEANKQQKGVNAREEAKRYELEETKDLLNKLVHAENNVMGAFHPTMHNLVREIERETRFQQKPVGPIGKYITLLEPKWMSIVEKFFGNTLGGFVVTNHADGEILRDLIAKTKCRAPFFVTPPKKFDIVEPARQFATIYRILEISDEMARKQLIIGHGAEQAILIEDLAEANKVMEHRRAEDNIAQCFALNSTREGWGHRVGGGQGVMSTAPVSKYSGMSRMKTHGPGQTESVQSDVQRLETELERLKSEARDIQQTVADWQQALTGFTRRKRYLATQISREEDEIEHLQGRIDEIAADGELSVLQQQLRLAEENKQVIMNQCVDLETNRMKLNEEQEELSRLMKGVDQDLARATQRVENAKLERATIKQRRDQALLDNNHWHAKLEEYRKILAEHEAHHATLVDTVQSHTEQALAICPPVEVPAQETAHSLDKRLERLGREIDIAEAALGGNKEEIAAAYSAAAKEYHAGLKLCSGFDVLLQAATSVLTERRKRWTLFQSYISARARAQFTWMMSERAFKGRLRLEHSARPPELIIEVQPGGESSGNRGPKTLSGGEKSFSTICLLLSLWEAMGSPIRCLDEFDVFMDSVNRTISVEMMIKAAERSVGKQFILITPQNMSQVNSTRCRISRMPDPERNGSNQARLAMV